MNEYMKIQEMWNKEFPQESEDERYIPICDENKEKIIDFYVKRLLFCDKIKKQGVTENMNTFYIQGSDVIRMAIYEDIKKSKYQKLINREYLLQLLKQ